MKINELQTPCLLLHEQRVQHNIAKMQGQADLLGVQLRTHGKTAKSIDVHSLLAQKHREKITVSTLKEAEYFFGHGITDILYAVGITPNKLPRVAAIIEQGAVLTVILDSLEQVAQLAEYSAQHQVLFPILIEIDCDGARAGITPNSERLLDIAQGIEAAPNLQFKGIMTHAGGSYHCLSIEAIQAMAKQEQRAALTCIERLNRAGLNCDIVSVGSTPTVTYSKDMSGITELRAGVFVFQDLVMHGLGVCEMNEIGLSVLTSVIGKNYDKQWLLVDAGWMALSRDRGTASQPIDFQYGQVCDQHLHPLDGLTVTSTNQEHGIIDLSTHKNLRVDDFKVGDLLQVLPNHACATAAMHSEYQVVNAKHDVIAQWPRINGW